VTGLVVQGHTFVNPLVFTTDERRLMNSATRRRHGEHQPEWVSAGGDKEHQAD